MHAVFGCRASVLAIFEVYISQGSAATRFGCGEIFDCGFIANFPESVPVKELWKSVENWLRYRYEFGVPVFLEHGVYTVYFRRQLRQSYFSF